MDREIDQVIVGAQVLADAPLEVFLGAREPMPIRPRGLELVEEAIGVVQAPSGAATAGFPTPHSAREHTPPHDFLERRESVPDPFATGEKPLKPLHS